MLGPCLLPKEASFWAGCHNWQMGYLLCLRPIPSGIDNISISTVNDSDCIEDVISNDNHKTQEGGTSEGFLLNFEE